MRLSETTARLLADAGDEQAILALHLLGRAKAWGHAATGLRGVLTAHGGRVACW